MIEGLEQYRKAGKIASEAREYGRKLIKVGASLLEVSDKIEKKIEELGGKPAFPTQISLNQIAAHYCAKHDDETIFKQGDLAKIDLGVHVDGYVADTACTVDLGNNAELVKAAEEALANAIKKIKPGATLGDIGKTIQETIQKHGFSPIRNLSGHAVGKYIIHGPPSIPNIDTRDMTELEEDMIIAIEPFATNGAGVIYEQEDAEVFMMMGRKSVRSAITRPIMKEIETFEGLPFTTRWLSRKFSLPKVNFALREIDNLGILKKFPPLPDKNKGLVSQAEHTVIVTKNGCEVTTL